MWAFAAGDAEAAAAHFRDAAVDAPADGIPQFWLGRALLALGQEREALAAIEAGLAAYYPPRGDPGRALAARAAAQLAAGDARAAAASLDEALAEGLDRNLEAIDRRPPWEGNFTTAAGADSNPHLLSEEIALPVPGETPARLIRGSEPDTLAELGLRVGFYPHYRAEGWNLGLTLDAGQSFHAELSELDLGRAKAAVHLAWGADPLGFLSGPLGSARTPFGSGRLAVLLQAGAGHTRLGGDSYLQTRDGAAALTFRETAATATQLEVAYSDREFSMQPLADPRRSGRDALVRLGQTFWFRKTRPAQPPPPGELPAEPVANVYGPRLRLSLMAADRDAGRAFAATTYEGKVELAFPVGLAWRASFEAAARRDDFDQPESNLFAPAGPPRQDDTLRAAAALSWRAGARLLWTARTTWTDRDSNVDLGPGLPDLDYRRVTATVGASWAF